MMPLDKWKENGQVSGERETRVPGLLLVFLAAVMWSFAGACVKYVSWSALSIGCIRGIFAAIAIGIVNRCFIFRPTKAICIGALGTFGTSLLFMLSTKITTAANAIVLQYTAPVFVIFLSFIVLKTRPSRRDLITVGVTFLGIALSFLDHIGHGALFGDFLALISGITFAMAFFANSLSGADAMKASYLGCLLNVLLLPFFLTDQAVWEFNITEWLVMAAMGIFQMGLSYIFFSLGMRTVKAVSGSIICTIEPILNPVWTFLVVGEQPGKYALIGGGIVVLAIAFYNLSSIRHSSRKS